MTRPDLARWHLEPRSGLLLPFPPQIQAEKAEREKHRAKVQENQARAWALLLSKVASEIAVNSGHSHLQMGMRPSILENTGPIADISLLLPPNSRIREFTGAHIRVLVNIGSPLSSFLARLLDGHSDTLERVRRPVLGNALVTEFDTSGRSDVTSYIDGKKVTEPYREIVTAQSLIFAPTLNSAGIPEQDALVLKVLRGRSGKPTFLSIEGWGPAGTVYGFKMLLEDSHVLSELARFESDSFEAVVAVENVRADRVNRTMTAAGPLHLVYCGCIPGPEDEAQLNAAFRSIAEREKKFIPDIAEQQKKNIIDLATKKRQGVALGPPKCYNFYAPASSSLTRKESMERGQVGQHMETEMSREAKKVREEFSERSVSQDRENGADVRKPHVMIDYGLFAINPFSGEIMRASDQTATLLDTEWNPTDEECAAIRRRVEELVRNDPDPFLGERRERDGEPKRPISKCVEVLFSPPIDLIS